MSIDWIAVNDRLKGDWVYWVAVTILVCTIFFMIKDFNRYEVELHDYYRDLMTKQNCLPVKTTWWANASIGNEVIGGVSLNENFSGNKNSSG